MKTYKVWVEIEECDDSADTFERIESPICIADFAEPKAYSEALRMLRAFASLFDPEINRDYAYALEEDKG